MDVGLKVLHDRLLAERPEGAVHDAENCLLCTMQEHDGGTFARGGNAMTDKTYTEDELKAKVEEAVRSSTAELASQLDALRTSQQQSETDTAIAEAKAEREAEIADFQSRLDAAVLEAAEAKKAREELETFLASAKEEQERQLEIAARRDDRLAKVREVASFPEEYLTANADRFAAMSDEDFDARLEEWRTIAGRTEEIPAFTSMTASADNGGIKGSMLGELAGLRSALSSRNL